jgi:2-C-methyl-D-erythritol 4-phosphate cytidylyltransferase
LTSRYFGLIPAAGSGSRFNAGKADLPKQYRPLGKNGRSMLEHSVHALLAAPQIDTVFVVLSPGDAHFRTLDWSEVGNRGQHAQHAQHVEPLYCGGGTRRDSVLNGLVAISPAVNPDDWVLVHDAARPCLQKKDLLRLLTVAGGDAEGGILAVPVADTLKRGDGDDCIVATEPRDGLWQAQTPQMFRYGLLMRALLQAPDVTDEAGAVEKQGLRPKLVRGSPMNLKVTVPEDLVLAELILGRE